MIEREYGIALSAASIGNYLKRWGMSPQKPVRRACERDGAAIRRRLETDYPAIAADAKRRRALIFWADECGVRSDDVRGRGVLPPKVVARRFERRASALVAA